MSKRVSNKTHMRKRPARSRVTLGWKKVKMLSDLEKMNKAELEGNVEEEMQAKFEDFKARARTQLKSFFPSRLFRKQAR